VHLKPTWLCWFRIRGCILRSTLTAHFRSVLPRTIPGTFPVDCLAAPRCRTSAKARLLPSGLITLQLSLPCQLAASVAAILAILWQQAAECQPVAAEGRRAEMETSEVQLMPFLSGRITTSGWPYWPDWAGGLWFACGIVCRYVPFGESTVVTDSRWFLWAIRPLPTQPHSRRTVVE
jgi:hypothetical protein